MPEFTYTARTPDGQLKKNRIKIKDRKALSKYLKDQGLMLTSAKPVKHGGKFSIEKLGSMLSTVPIVEKIFFTQNLSVMIKTGFSLAAALKTLAEQTDNKKFQNIILDIQHEVESGVSFSNALAKHDDVFSELFINMVAAGEISGKLDEIMENLTNQMKKDHTLIVKVRSAMMYPAVIVVAMVGIGIVMMITVIPQMLAIYADTEAELPLPTKVLLVISNSLTDYGIYIAAVLVALFFVLMRARKTAQGKRLLHKLFLKTPIMSGIIKKINLARFTRTLSSLLKTDIPIVQTLQVISKTLGNVYYKKAMLSASEKVKKGITISRTLQESPKLFPPIVVQMINVGEESGTLDTITEEIANFYEEDVDQTMEGLSTIIEPVLMLIIGAIVGVMALAVLMPMYGLVEAI